MGGNEPLFRVQTGGAFVAPSTLLRQIPEFCLRRRPGHHAGPPGRHLPGSRAVQPPGWSGSSEAGVQAILEAARAAGLFGPDRQYTTMTISDAPTTTFTLVSDGRRHTMSVYALGADAGSSGMSSDEDHARAALGLAAEAVQRRRVAPRRVGGASRTSSLRTPRLRVARGSPAGHRVAGARGRLAACDPPGRCSASRRTHCRTRGARP